MTAVTLPELRGRLSLLLTFGLICGKVCLAAGSDIASEVVDQENIHRLRLGVSPSLVTVSGSGQKITGLDLGLKLLYAASPRFGLRAGASEGLGAASRSAVYSQLSAGAEFALTGELVARDHFVTMNGREVFSSTGGSSGGIRLGAYVGQLFFLTSKSAIPFTGAGGSAGYEFASRGPWTVFLRGEAGRYQSAQAVTTILGFSGELLFWL